MTQRDPRILAYLQSNPVTERLDGSPPRLCIHELYFDAWFQHSDHPLSSFNQVIHVISLLIRWFTDNGHPRVVKPIVPEPTNKVQVDEIASFELSRRGLGPTERGDLFSTRDAHPWDVIRPGFQRRLPGCKLDLVFAHAFPCRLHPGLQTCIRYPGCLAQECHFRLAFDDPLPL